MIDFPAENFNYQLPEHKRYNWIYEYVIQIEQISVLGHWLRQQVCVSEYRTELLTLELTRLNTKGINFVRELPSLRSVNGLTLAVMTPYTEGFIFNYAWSYFNSASRCVINTFENIEFSLQRLRQNKHPEGVGFTIKALLCTLSCLLHGCLFKKCNN